MGDVGSNLALAQRCNMCWKVRGVSGKERAHSDLRVLCSCSMLMILARQQYCSKFTVVVVYLYDPETSTPSSSELAGSEWCVLSNAVWPPVLRILLVPALRPESDMPLLWDIPRRSGHYRSHPRPGAVTFQQDDVPGTTKVWFGLRN